MAWRRWQKTIRKLAAEMLDMPQELVLDVPKLTVIGDIQLLIENHRGVDLFRDDLVRLKLADGRKLEIAGDHLAIVVIMPDEIQMEGTVRRIEYVK